MYNIDRGESRGCCLAVNDFCYEIRIIEDVRMGWAQPSQSMSPRTGPRSTAQLPALLQVPTSMPATVTRQVQVLPVGKAPHCVGVPAH